MPTAAARFEPLHWPAQTVPTESRVAVACAPQKTDFSGIRGFYRKVPRGSTLQAAEIGISFDESDSAVGPGSVGLDVRDVFGMAAYHLAIGVTSWEGCGTKIQAALRTFLNRLLISDVTANTAHWFAFAIVSPRCAFRWVRDMPNAY